MNNPVNYFHWKIIALAGIWTRDLPGTKPIDLSCIVFFQTNMHRCLASTKTFSIIFTIHGKFCLMSPAKSKINFSNSSKIPKRDFLLPYSVDLNIDDHLNTGNIWIPTFLKFGFQMVWYSNGWFMCYGLCTRLTIWISYQYIRKQDGIHWSGWAV